MPNFPSVFPLWWVTLTAAIASVVSLLVLRWRFKELSAQDAVLVSVVVGLSVFAWRLAGNIPSLNDDPIPPFSPNDFLCPIFTYVMVGLYAAWRPGAGSMRWEQARAWLTLISFVVNVLVI